MQIRAIATLASIYSRQGRSVLARLMTEKVLSHGDQVSPDLRAHAHSTIGVLEFESGEYDRACEAWAVSLGIYRDLGLAFEECKVLSNLARGYLERNRPAPARRYGEMSVSIANEHGLEGLLGNGLQLQALVGSVLPAGDRGEVEDDEELAALRLGLA